MRVKKKIKKLFVYFWMNICLSTITYRTCVQKFRNPSIALIGSKSLSQKNSLKLQWSTPRILYCINVYGCGNLTSLQKLKIKQKEAIRTIANVGYKEHTNPLFKKLKILPIEKLIKFANLKFMHNFAHSRLPFSFSEMWTTNRAKNPNLVLKNGDDYYVPTHKMASVKRFPYFYFPKIWNEANNSKRNPNKITYILKVLNLPWSMKLLTDCLNVWVYYCPPPHPMEPCNMKMSFIVHYIMRFKLMGAPGITHELCSYPAVLSSSYPPLSHSAHAKH